MKISRLWNSEYYGFDCRYVEGAVMYMKMAVFWHAAPLSCVLVSA
jgi:hypothetical protein